MRELDLHLLQRTGERHGAREAVVGVLRHRPVEQPLQALRRDDALTLHAEYGVADRLSVQLKAEVQSGEDAFVDYEGQSFEDKVKVLESNPATRDLPAVKEKRFLNLPIPAWTSSPLNITPAEQLRVALEEHDLVPASDIEPEHDLEP